MWICARLVPHPPLLLPPFFLSFSFFFILSFPLPPFFPHPPFPLFLPSPLLLFLHSTFFSLLPTSSPSLFSSHFFSFSSSSSSSFSSFSSSSSSSSSTGTSVYMVVIGCITVVVSFIGCLGAAQKNICLLLLVSLCV